MTDCLAMTGLSRLTSLGLLGLPNRCDLSLPLSDGLVASMGRGLGHPLCGCRWTDYLHFTGGGAMDVVADGYILVDCCISRDAPWTGPPTDHHHPSAVLSLLLLNTAFQVLLPLRW